MAKQAYVCETCGALAEEPGHLCNPKGAAMSCTYCGMEHDPHVKHFCKGKVEDLHYFCDQCGRLATSEEFLCQPKKLPE